MPMGYSRRQASIESSLCPRTIDKAIANGHLPAYRVGRKVVITPQDLRRFLKGRRVATKAERKNTNAAA